MSLIEWNSSYSLGMNEIDEHHKHLVNLLNSLYDKIVFNKNVDIGAIFDELVAYVKYHFAAEEMLMQEAEYRGYASHTEKHNEFIKNIHEFNSVFLAGDLSVITDTMIYLKDWLFDHILKSDRKYITLLIKKRMV